MGRNTRIRGPALVLTALAIGACKGNSTPGGAATCGDQRCGASESCTSCPADCGPCGPVQCGDGDCVVTAGEDCGCCPEDCGTCTFGPNDRFVDGVNGDDDNDGTAGAPFQTIQQGVEALGPGQTLHIRAGNYPEAVVVSASGTAEAPIVIRGHLCERPVIDGQDQGPGLWRQLIWVRGNYVILSDLEVANSTGHGIKVWAPTGTTGVTIRDVWIHHAVNTGIFAEYFTDLTIEAARIWVTNRINDPDRLGYQENMWGGGIQPRIGTNLVIRRSAIWQSYGEGINVHSNVDGGLIEDNVIYDSFGPLLYPLNSRRLLIQRNLIYHTDDPEFRRGGEPGAGIVLADENKTWDEWLMEDYTIVNNMVVGTSQLFAFWTGWHADSGMKNILIAHNTFVNAHRNGGGWGGAIAIEEGDHATARFENNLILQVEGGMDMITLEREGTSPTFANNLWWPRPPAGAAASSGDVIKDPLLSLSGELAPGLLGPDHFRLNAGSPAIDAATTPSNVAFDFFGTARGAAPDIGAHEQTGH